MPANTDPITIDDNNDIPWNNEVKYLVITMDEGLTWKKHIHMVRGNAKAITMKLYPLVGRRTLIQPQTKLTLIKTIMRTQLIYGSAAWRHAAKSYLKKLKSIGNVFLRAVTNTL